MKTCMAVTIDRDLFKQIEALRGREKRSTFVEHLLRLGLKHYLDNKSRKKIDVFAFDVSAP